MIIKCPYCGANHTDVLRRAKSWGCRDCMNIFTIPFWSWLLGCDGVGKKLT